MVEAQATQTGACGPQSLDKEFIMKRWVDFLVPFTAELLVAHPDHMTEEEVREWIWDNTDFADLLKDEIAPQWKGSEITDVGKPEDTERKPDLIIKDEDEEEDD
jgi:hypothetical protein